MNAGHMCATTTRWDTHALHVLSGVRMLERRDHLPSYSKGNPDSGKDQCGQVPCTASVDDYDYSSCKFRGFEIYTVATLFSILMPVSLVSKNKRNKSSEISTYQVVV